MMPRRAIMAERARKIWKRTLLVAASLLSSAAAAEVLFRVLAPSPYAAPVIVRADQSEVPLSEIIGMLRASGDPASQAAGPASTIRGDLHFKLRYDRPEWDYFDADGCVDIDINSLGFRDREFSAEKPEGELRILAIGDSFTFGSGVQLEDTWPQLLESLLREQTERPVEVINAGYAGGHWPPTYAPWLASDGIELDPDVVIIGLCLNDMQLEIPMMFVPPPPQPWLGGHSALLNWVQQWRFAQQPIEFDYGDAFRPLPEPMRSRLSADEVARIEAWRKPWEDAKASLVAMRDLARARGVRLVVAIFPMLSYLGDDYPYLGLHEIARAFCDDQQIECVDLLPAFRHRDEQPLWVHATDQHPNDVGQRIIATGIRDFLNL